MKWSKGKQKQREKLFLQKGEIDRDFGHFVVNSKSNLKQAGTQRICSDRNEASTQNARSVSKDTKLLQILMKLLQILMRNEEQIWLCLNTTFKLNVFTFLQILFLLRNSIPTK